MLHGANLPYNLWAETWETARYLYAKGLVTALKKDTPESMFFRRKVKVSHLKAFGCIAYAQVPKKLRRKLEPNSEKLVMIGYSKQVKGYRLWNPINNKIVVSRDVIFNEATIGVDMKPTHAPLLEGDTSGSDATDDDVEYKVERIIDERNHEGITQYLVEWTGYDESENNRSAESW